MLAAYTTTYTVGVSAYTRINFNSNTTVYTFSQLGGNNVLIVPDDTAIANLWASNSTSNYYGVAVLAGTGSQTNAYFAFMTGAQFPISFNAPTTFTVANWVISVSGVTVTHASTAPTNAYSVSVYQW
jgi:hypothetical protein